MDREVGDEFGVGGDIRHQWDLKGCNRGKRKSYRVRDREIDTIPNLYTEKV